MLCVGWKPKIVICDSQQPNRALQNATFRFSNLLLQPKLQRLGTAKLDRIVKVELKPLFVYADVWAVADYLHTGIIATDDEIINDFLQVFIFGSFKMAPESALHNFYNQTLIQWI